MIFYDELPCQTWERITGQFWPGGTSSCIRALLRIFGIDRKPGSAEANLALQEKIAPGFCPACGRRL